MKTNKNVNPMKSAVGKVLKIGSKVPKAPTSKTPIKGDKKGC